MSGSIVGGKRAAETNKRIHGSDFYQRIGAIGGKNGTTGGFYQDKVKAKKAGSLGGQKSKRGHKLLSEDEKFRYYLEKSTGKTIAVAIPRKHFWDR